MPIDTIKPLLIKSEKSCVKVKCPYCGKYNDAAQSKCYGIEKEAGFFVMSFYRTCAKCEEELYFKFKTRNMSAEVLVEE